MRERNRQRWLSVVAVLMGLVLLGGFSASLNFAPSKGPIESVLAADMITPPEYRTRWEQEAGIIYSMRLPDEYAGMRPAAIVQGTGSVGVVAQTARSITVHADIKSPAATIAIRRFYFPGWIVKNRNAEIGHVDALLSLRVSQGDNEYALTVPWFAGEKEGLAITLLVSTILVAWVGINQRWRWSKPRI